MSRPRPGIIPRRPALPAALGIIAGIWSAFQLPAAPWVFITITLLTALAAIALWQRSAIASLLVAIAMVSLGVTLGQSEYFSYSTNEIASFTSEEPHLAQVELRLDDPPYLTSSTAGGRQLPPKQMAIVSVQRILTRAGWVNASGKTLVEITHPHPWLAAGQTLRVLGMLQRPAHATNPGEFDWAEHYRQQRILCILRISRAENIEILSEVHAGVIDWLRTWARDLLAMGFTNAQGSDHALLRALVLGDADPSIRESQTQFEKIGVAYLLSVSGMHIAVAAGCVYGICRLLRYSPRFACILCLLVVLLYGMIALPHTSALRAVLLCCAILIGILAGQSVDKLQLLSIVAGVLLCLHPMELFNAGFQLGFICILGLLLFAGPVLRWMAEPKFPEGERAAVTPGIGMRTWRLLRDWLAISLVAWAVSLPIVAIDFQQLSPWAIPSGVVLFPVVAIALLSGCGKILLTLLWPSLAGWWAHGAILPVILMKHLAASLAHLPAAAVPVSPPGVAVVMIYYFLLILPLLPWRRKWLRSASIGVAAAAICCLIAGLSLGFPATSATQHADGVSITFLDVGAGQTAVVQIADHPPVLIDAGSSTISDVTRSVLGPFLSQHGYRTIAAAFLSHSDYDHISAIASVLPTFRIATVYTSHYFAHFASIDPPAQSLLDQLNHANKSPHLIQRGDHVQLSSDSAIDVLWPPPNCSFNCNNTGLVLRLSVAGESVLFPADIQVDAMRELLKSPQQLKSDVLVAAHHGSSEMTTPAFVSAVDPKFIISSNGSPLTEKQKRFEQMIGSLPLYRTSHCGAITLHFRPNGSISIETFLPPGPNVRKN